MNPGSFLDRYGKILLIGVGSLLGIALIVWWFFFYEMRLTVTATPSSATVLIDGTDVTGQTKVKLKPGAHTVKVTLNDYIPFEETINAKSTAYATMPVTLRAVPHLQLITKDSAVSASYDPTIHALYYRNQVANDVERAIVPTGDTASSDGASIPKPQILTPAAFSGVQNWIWGPGYDLALFQKGGAWSLYSFNRFDLVNQSTTAWPANVGSVSWNPSDSSQLAHYFAPSADNQTLIRANPIHTTSDVLMNFRDSGITDPIVHWVGNGSDIVLQSKEGRLWRFVVYTKSLTAITQSETVTESVASPDGQTLLVRQTDGGLFLIGIDGKNKRAVSLQAPLAETAWSVDSKSVWFVIPDSTSLTVTKLDATTNTASRFTIAPSESVGTIDSVASLDEVSRLAIAGSAGIGLLRLEPSTYTTVIPK